jgi:hypothetical protein
MCLNVVLRASLPEVRAFRSPTKNSPLLKPWRAAANCLVNKITDPQMKRPLMWMILDDTAHVQTLTPKSF